MEGPPLAERRRRRPPRIDWSAQFRSRPLAAQQDQSGGCGLDHRTAAALRPWRHHQAMRSAADASRLLVRERALAVSAEPARRSRSSSSPSSWTSAFVAFSAGAGLLAWDVRFAYLPAAEAVLDGDSPYPALDDPILEDQKGYVYPPQLAVVLVAAHAASDRSRRAARHGGHARAALAHAPDPRASATCAATRRRCCGCRSRAACCSRTSRSRWRSRSLSPGGIATRVASLPSRSGSPSRRSSSSGRCSSGCSRPGESRTTLWAIADRCRRDVRSRGRRSGSTGSAATRPPPAALRHPVRAQLLDRGHGLHARLERGGGAGARRSSLGGALLVACVVLARRGDDLRSFTCAVAATLALSPIVWLHYLVLLLVPLAIARPRFSVVWLLPILLWSARDPGMPRASRPSSRRSSQSSSSPSCSPGRLPGNRVLVTKSA